MTEDLADRVLRLQAQIAALRRELDAARERHAISQSVAGDMASALDDARADIAKLEAARPLAEALTKQLIALAIGGCTCGVKSPQAHWHEPTCTFRRAEEALENAEAIREVLGRGE